MLTCVSVRIKHTCSTDITATMGQKLSAFFWVPSISHRNADMIALTYDDQVWNVDTSEFGIAQARKAAVQQHEHLAETEWWYCWDSESHIELPPAFIETSNLSSIGITFTPPDE